MSTDDKGIAGNGHKSNGGHDTASHKGPDESKHGSVTESVMRLSKEADELSEGSPGAANRKERAAELDKELQQLWPQIQAADIPDKPAVMQTWANTLVTLGRIAREGSSGDGGAEGLQQTLNDLNSRAFQLAREVSKPGNDQEKSATEARQLNERLTALRPQLDAAPAELKYSLEQAWTDARLDLDYVLAGGEGTSSLRLFHYLQSRDAGQG